MTDVPMVDPPGLEPDPIDSNSILNTVKKYLGIAADYKDFDIDIVMLINGVFATLNQLDVGQDDGFEIHGLAETWSDFTSHKTLNNVKNYISMKVKLMFDPPQSAHAEAAMVEMCKEYEFRLNVESESLKGRE